jgi:alpha-tubulin suppressor-like RCC1 family protein
VNAVGAVMIAAGSLSSYALLYNGTVLAWGMNDSGELGDGTTTGRYFPVQTLVPALDQVIQISAGDKFACYLTVAGNVSCFGDTAFYRLGAQYQNSIQSSPIQVPLGTNKTSKILCGGDYTLAVTVDGFLFGWGNGFAFGLTGGVYIPATMLFNVWNAPWGTKRVVDISGGELFTIVMTEDGKLYGAGKNDAGQVRNPYISIYTFALAWP